MLSVEAADKRVESMTMAMIKAIEGRCFESVIKALCALRGVDVVSAIGLVAEIGDIGRVDHPRKLMGYLGLVPAYRSLGASVPSVSSVRVILRNVGLHFFQPTSFCAVLRLARSECLN